MPRGGRRPGAGRKPGSANVKTREIADRAAAEGLTPLEYLLSVMRDQANNPARRDEAAKAAAPYIHPRLTATSVTGDKSKPVTVSVEDTRRSLAEFLAEWQDTRSETVK